MANPGFDTTRMHLVAPWFLIARVETIMSGKVDEENLVCTFFQGSLQ